MSAPETPDTAGEVGITVIIPALNEEASLPRVLEAIPAGLAREVLVVDNGSTDATAEVAARLGARVTREEQRGYGAACLRGLDALRDDTDIVVFLDADFSDHPEEMPALVEPILRDEADLVIGSRTLERRGRGALLPQAYWGNRLGVLLIRWRWGFRYTDLGPFRAIRRSALERLGMRDHDFGWTVEMQIRALQEGLRVLERPVRYRSRIGKSKISGTLSGTVRAGFKILWTILRLALERRRRHSRA